MPNIQIDHIFHQPKSFDSTNFSKPTSLHKFCFVRKCQRSTYNEQQSKRLDNNIMLTLLEYENWFFINMGNGRKRVNWIDGKYQSGTQYIKRIIKLSCSNMAKLAFENLILQDFKCFFKDWYPMLRNSVLSCATL